MTKILLHTCCGPCFLGFFEGLKEPGFDIYHFWFNPNIQPTEEYENRLENLKKAARGKSTDILISDYQPQLHAEAILGKKDQFPTRCLECYRLRLAETAKTAKGEKFDFFSTTLLISPYQKHDDLKKIGEKLAEKFGVGFYYKDLRPYFRQGQKIAELSGIYSQKYCGCLYSKDYR